MEPVAVARYGVVLAGGAFVLLLAAGTALNVGPGTVGLVAVLLGGLAAVASATASAQRRTAVVAPGAD